MVALRMIIGTKVLFIINRQPERIDNDFNEKKELITSLFKRYSVSKSFISNIETAY